MYDELSRKVKELEAKLSMSHHESVPMPAEAPATPATDGHAERLPVEEESAVDELATQVFNEIPERNIGHFGAASNHAFFRMLSSAFAYQIPLMLQLQHLPSHQSASNHVVTGTRSLSTSPEGDVDRRPNVLKDSSQPAVDPYIVPNDQEIAELVSRFFVTTGVVLPFIEKSAFLHPANKPVWLTTRSGRALLNIICAHAYLAANRVTAEVYYSRTVALLDTYTVHGASLELRTS
jgi:hypothetical protein